MRNPLVFLDSLIGLNPLTLWQKIEFTQPLVEMMIRAFLTALSAVSNQIVTKSAFDKETIRTTTAGTWAFPFASRAFEAEYLNDLIVSLAE